MSDRMDQAAKITDEVQALVGTALKRLEAGFNGRIANGFGIYSDPARQRDSLRQSMAELNTALERMTTTSWPTSADYDAAEAEGS